MKRKIVLGSMLFISILLTSSSVAANNVAFAENSTDAISIYQSSDTSNLLINPDHPRNDGLWLQYYPLTTALRKNIIISDVITPDSQWESWDGSVVSTHSMETETAENYDNSHNHYQNFLSEVLNFASGTNAVAIWGDSSAVVDGSKAWGAFFSARSNAPTFLTDEFSKYVPDGVEIDYDPKTYDTQLIGVEIDVLNDGLPGVYPNMSKTGLQIVGFGNPNSMAIEVRSEDTDKENVSDEERRGVFESGLYFKNSIAPYGRLIVSDFETARIGLDFNSTLFKEGAIKLKSQQVGTGIIYNDGFSGEIYGGSRWGNDNEEWLTLRAGTGGIRVVSNDNTKELLAIDNYGGLYLNGDVYINGQRIESMISSGVSSDSTVPNEENDTIKIILIIVSILMVFVILFFVFLVLPMKKKILELEKKIAES